MPRVDKDTFIQEMLQAHEFNRAKPVPDSAEWWKEVAQGVSVKAFDAEQALTTARQEIAALTRERDEARDFILRAGYRRCDVPACNCGSWHGGHLYDRLREIEAALSDADIDWAGTVLKTAQAALAELATLRAQHRAAVEARDRALDACRLALSMYDRHDLWCGNKAGSPGDSIHRQAANALRAVVGPASCLDCGTTDFTSGRGDYEDGVVCGMCAQVRALLTPASPDTAPAATGSWVLSTFKPLPESEAVIVRDYMDGPDPAPVGEA
jgi:hypothetical protein